MKVSKRQLRRIIKEEKQKLNEYGGTNITPADRAIGSYFDVDLMARLRNNVQDLWDDAVDSAIDFDGLEVDEAEDAVTAGFEKLFKQALDKARRGR